jgi:hypothetical protein
LLLQTQLGTLIYFLPAGSCLATHKDFPRYTQRAFIYHRSNQMATVGSFQTSINKFIDAAGDGISFIDFGMLFEQLKILAMEKASQLALEGYEKKQLVLDALASFIDNKMPLPVWLFWAKPMIKKLLLSLASGAIETLYKKYIKPKAT